MIVLTNYTLRGPSVGELSGKAAESIFFMYGDRPATGCHSDSGASLCLIPARPQCLAFQLCFLTIWIYLHWRIPWSVFQESHQLGNPLVGGGPRGEAPEDNLDIAQASFELPWQIPVPTRCNFHLKNTLKCLAAGSLICRRSCLRWSPIPLPRTSYVTHWSRNLVIYGPTLFIRLMLL